MCVRDMANEIYESLSALVGQRLVQSRSFLATRHFYFGRANREDEARFYTLGVECPWRIRRNNTVVVGSADYYEKADNNTDESWQAGSPLGHLQNQRLGELLGTLEGDRVINTGAALTVEFVTAHACGGLGIGLTESCVLELFPASSREMEWIFMVPGEGSVVFMNGMPNRVTKDVGTDGEPGEAGTRRRSD